MTARKAKTKTKSRSFAALRMTSGDGNVRESDFHFVRKNAERMGIRGVLAGQKFRPASVMDAGPE
ncbi:hypothetical protein ACFPT7_22965 [Acidicapsa dinghuensis]|uniref:Uncharacterized protein n=1 Tax=Acidicapsa dinghuensis TaxID=2218256 RepID=A0ABW1EMS6_9BACT|nr:hypothetical protein [Acidicapsa dinghuensis]